MTMKTYLFLLSLVLPFTCWGQVVLDKPQSKHATSFAIVTDKITYDKTNKAINDYRNAVENDGLSTYVLYADWKNPEELRNELQRLYKSDRTLEGIVLVGDIPVACIRNAQHLTTAFKMNEKKFPFPESSVPSDRFYDDLHLTFDFIVQDSADASKYYYKLREDSPQKISPSFYSARIKYPEKRGGDKYKAIAAFLEKAAKAKSEPDNPLDYVVSFTGSAYNSECLIAWMDEERAYKENFPLAWKNSQHFKHYNFRMNAAMKYKLFDELQRPEIDLFMFHEHGAPTQQLINNEPEGSSFNSRYDIIRWDIYANVRRAVSKGTPLDTIKSYYQKEYGIADSFFDKLNDKTLQKADSTTSADCIIHVQDLKNLNTYPKVIMFDACYNGSFHEDDYIAGYYIFNDGNTLAVQGNTRNVLQDRWTIEMIGLLSHGVRVGQYNSLIYSLEGHLMGDPTVRFTPIEKNSVTTDLTLKAKNNSIWLNLLKSKYADLQMVAMRKLADNNYQGEKFSKQLLDIYKASPYNTVRMEAIRLLSRYANADFTEAVKLGIHDSYELIARLSATYAGEIGAPELWPSVLDAFINEGQRARVNYALSSTMDELGYEEGLRILPQIIEQSNRFNPQDDLKQLTEFFKKRQNTLDRAYAVVMDKNANPDKRINNIRMIRNYNYHYHVDDYLKILADNEENEEVRVNIAEALGWFTHSIKKEQILKQCKALLSTKKLPKSLSDEVLQTINRLK